MNYLIRFTTLLPLFLIPLFLFGQKNEVTISQDEYKELIRNQVQYESLLAEYNGINKNLALEKEKVKQATLRLEEERQKNLALSATNKKLIKEGKEAKASNSLSTKYAKLKEENNKLKKELEEANTKKTEFENEYKKKEASNKVLRDQINQYVEDINSSSQGSQSEIQRLTNEKQDIERERDDLIAKLDDRVEELATYKEEIGKLEANIESFKGLLREKDSEIQKAYSAKDTEVKKSKGRFQQELNIKDNEITLLNQELEKQGRKIESLNSETEELKKTIKQLRKVVVGKLDENISTLINSPNPKGSDIEKVSDYRQKLREARDKGYIKDISEDQRKLSSYQNFVIAISTAEKALGSKYDASGVDAAIRELRTVKRSSPEQEELRQSLGTALTGYCALNTRISRQTADALYFLPDQESAREELSGVLRSLSSSKYNRYTYLKQQLRKKLDGRINGTNPFPKTSCR